jgi:DnaJ domain
VDIYRRPEGRKTWADPQRLLPEEVSVVVELANLPPGAPRIEHYARRLRASPSELHAAIGFFIRQIFLAPEADHYRVLGLNPGADIQRIREHYRKLIGRFHPDRLQGRDEWYENYSVRINQAYTVLRNPSKRRAYDAGLCRRTGPVPAARSDRRRSRPPAYAKRVSSVRPSSRRSNGIPLRVLFASTRIAWQSIKTYASTRRRWRRKAIRMRGPSPFWQRLYLLLSVTAIAGCLALVLDSARSLRLPSVLNALGLGLSSSMTSPSAANHAAPAADTPSDSAGLTPSLPPPNSAAIGDSTKNGTGTAPRTVAAQTATSTHDNARTLAERDQPKARTKAEPPARKIRTATAPDKRQMLQSLSVPNAKADAMAPAQQSDHHDTASPPIAPERHPQRPIPERSTPPKVAQMRLSRLEAERLLNRFRWAYEAGSINHFMQLFAEQAHTGYQVHRDGIRTEYAQLFAETSHRRLAFYDFRWQLLGAKGTGEGRFVVTIQHKGETTPSVTRGRLILHIRKTDHGVLITELLHIRQ